MKVLTFTASTTHKWSSVVVTLDSVDYNFGKDYLCLYSDTLSSNRPSMTTLDGKTFTITDVSFDPVNKETRTK